MSIEERLLSVPSKTMHPALSITPAQLGLALLMSLTQPSDPHWKVHSVGDAQSSAKDGSHSQL